MCIKAKTLIKHQGQPFSNLLGEWMELPGLSSLGGIWFQKQTTHNTINMNVSIQHALIVICVIRPHFFVYHTE